MKLSLPVSRRHTSHALRASLPAAALLALALASAPAALAATRCVVADNGSGSISFPPFAPPGYQSPDDVTMIENGLPAGTLIIGRMTLTNIALTLETPGGVHGGRIHDFTCDLVLTMHGTGTLTGINFNRTLPAVGRVESAPGAPWAISQSVLCEFSRIQAQVTGDPDFDLLRVTGGTDFGMPSSGTTKLTRQPNGDWEVDSFFDVTYRVDFVGAPTGPLGGMSGSTVANTRLREGLPKPVVCIEPGFPLLFPPPCPDGYASPPDARVSLNGLPPGTPVTGTIRLANLVMTSDVPGGDLAGSVQTFDGDAVLELHGHGTTWYSRTLSFPVTGTCQRGPQTPGALVDGFPTELLMLQGQLPPGDPDFDLLRISAGTGFGMPSPGHTTLVMQPAGDYLVDSFFDITYRIDLVGHPGGPFGGSSGTDVFVDRFQLGQQRAGHACTVPDAGGTAELPASCPDGYESPFGALVALWGLPPGEPVLGRITLLNIVNVGETPGGSLGGTFQKFTGDCRMEVHGTGSLAGFTRSVQFPVTGTSAAAPRVPGASPQSFPMELNELQGQLPPGDPDFDLLRITAGGGFGMPSPGHTTLSQTALGDWAVDSFFDITYRVDFIGAPGGALAGRSGSTTATNRFRTAEYAKLAVPGGAVSSLRIGDPAPNPSSGPTTFAIDLPAAGRVSVSVYDVSGRRLARVADRAFPQGRHLLAWDGRGDDGARVAPGLYFVRVRAGGAEVARRVALRH